MHRAAEPNEDPTQWADPAAVTEVFIYLASDDSKKVNGKRLHAQDINQISKTVVAANGEQNNVCSSEFERRVKLSLTQ
jgi:hypothetical protein